MKEEEDFVKSFEKKFGKLKNKRIAIYGTGLNAEAIVTMIESYTFSCVIADGYQCQYFKGLMLLGIEEAIKISDIILIAAIPTSTNIIYKRIKNKVPDNIDIYDLRGHKLSENRKILQQLLKSVHTNQDRLLFKHFIQEYEKCSSLKLENVIQVNNYRTLAWLIVPITIVYMKHILKMARKYDFLLFASRDSFFLYKLYEKCVKKNNHKFAKGVYFYTSRSAISSACITNDDDILILQSKLTEDRHLNIAEFLNTQYHIEVPKCLNMSVDEAECFLGKEELDKQMKLLYGDIKEKSNQNRCNYLKYISKLKLFGNIAVVDIVTQGTIVFGVGKLLEKEIELIAMGTSAVPNNYIQEEKMVHSLFGNVNGKIKNTVYSFSDFSELHLFLEIFFSSDEGQVYKFSDNGDPIFVENSEYNKELIKGVQNEVEQIMKQLNIDLLNSDISEKFAMEMLRLLYQKYADYSADIKEKFIFSDPYDSHMKQCNLVDIMGM